MPLKIKFPYSRINRDACMSHFHGRLFSNVELECVPARCEEKKSTVIFDLDNTLIETEIITPSEFQMTIRPYMLKLAACLISNDSVEVILWTNGKMEYAVQAMKTIEEICQFEFDYIIARVDSGYSELLKNTTSIGRPDAVLIDDVLQGSRRQIQVRPYFVSTENILMDKRVELFVIDRLRSFGIEACCSECISC